MSGTGVRAERMLAGSVAERTRERRRRRANRSGDAERDAHVHRLGRTHGGSAREDRPHRAGGPHRHAGPAYDGTGQAGDDLDGAHGRPGEVPGRRLRQPARDRSRVRSERRPQQGGRRRIRCADPHRHRRDQRRHERGPRHDAAAAGHPRGGHRDEDGGLRRSLREARRAVGHGGSRQGAVRLLQGRLRRDRIRHEQDSRGRPREGGVPARRQGDEHHREELLPGPGDRPRGRQRR